MSDTDSIIQKAADNRIAVPAFNIPYLPMMKPVVEALRDTETFGLVMVANLELHKFEAGSLESIRDEYENVKDERFTRLHLDHVPVIDEDDKNVDYEEVLSRAVKLGYESIMIDGSRLSFEENIACTKKIADMAHGSGVPVEAELGAVMGHEAGPLPPYEELFASGKGFTDPEEALQFVAETGVNWLSVAVGSVHGAISRAEKDKKKVEARLDIKHLRKIYNKVNIPLVLHGGTGIRKEYIMDAFKNGIAKINVATAIRQPYERAVPESVEEGQKAVYDTMLRILKEDLEVAGSAQVLMEKE